MNSKLYIAALAAAVALAACGGGGGGSTAPTGAGAPAAAAPAPSTISTAPAPTPTYTGAEDLAAFNLLNSERANCHFGQLAENTHLDQAAKAHADWLLINNYVGHGEVAGTPGFTGVSPGDRMVAAGYAAAGAFAWGEDVDGTYGLDTEAGQGTAMERVLLGAPYHVTALTGPYQDVGLSLQNDQDAGATHVGRQLVIDLAYTSTAGPQQPGGADVLTYPCQGTAGTEWELTGESPPPRPNLATNPAGQPVVFIVRPGQTVSITSIAMTVAGTGAAVPLDTPVTSLNDVNGELQSNQAFVLPTSPLAPNTMYHVVASGLNNGVSWNKDFTFTTGI